MEFPAEEGKLGEAVQLARTCRDSHIAYARIVSRLVESTALTADSCAADAETWALEALALVEQTDMLDLHGDVLLALADLDIGAGRPGDAAHRMAEAIRLYERKGDVVSAGRARSREVPLGA